MNSNLILVCIALSVAMHVTAKPVKLCDGKINSITLPPPTQQPEQLKRKNFVMSNNGAIGPNNINMILSKYAAIHKKKSELSGKVEKVRVVKKLSSTSRIPICIVTTTSPPGKLQFSGGSPFISKNWGNLK